MAVLLALDPGERRTGIAICDADGILATPLCTHDRRTDRSLMDLIVGLCDEHGVVEVIVGHPLTQSGEVGESARRSERIAEKLRGRLRASGVAVTLADERYSTAEAQRILAGKGYARGHRDALAASLILQGVLDGRRE